MNRVFLVYLVTACLLYRGLYGHDRYRCLWLSVVSSVLLGISLLTTEGPEDDRALPLIVMSVFLFFTLICSKWLTEKLSRKTRFRVLCAGVIYFPILALLALGVDSFVPVIPEEGGAVYFDWFSMLHLAVLPIALFTGWRGRTMSLSLSTVAVLGLAYGAEWFGCVLLEKWSNQSACHLSFPSAIRLAAPIASLLVGWINACWECRFHSLLLCVLVADMFIFPMSAAWLFFCFSVAHQYASGGRWVGKGADDAKFGVSAPERREGQVLLGFESPSIGSTTDGGLSA